MEGLAVKLEGLKMLNAAVVEGTDGARPRVLVVDDEPAFAEAVAELLGESGFEAQPFSDPEEALRRTAKESYEVALLDLAMPRMSGLELAERVRELSPTTQPVDVPCAAASALTH